MHRPTDTHAYTAQILAWQAASRATADAVIQGDRSWSYQEFCALTVAFVQALRAFPVRPGMMVGIVCEDRVIHLLLVLACEALGAATASLAGNETTPANELLLRCDLVISEEQYAFLAACKVFQITQEWVASIERASTAADLEPLDHQANAGRIVRVVQTSGTGGQRKALAITAELNQRLIVMYDPNFREQLFGPLRTILVYSFSLRSAYGTALLTLQRGGTVIFSTEDTVYLDIHRHQANYIKLLVGDAERFLLRMPSDFAKPALLGVHVGGGVLVQRLKRALLQRAASHLIHVYSSNETGRVAHIDADDGIGTLYPGVQVAIVDETGALRPDGEAGIIKIRSHTMALGYLDPQLTAAAFKDGWFYTKDIGVMPAPGRLKVLGRADEMLNIGGLKVAPASIEESVKNVRGVRDAAATSAENANGVGVLLIAIEADATTDPVLLKAGITAAVQPFGCDCRYTVVPQLPRATNGKVRRRDVAGLFAAELGGESA